MGYNTSFQQPLRVTGMRTYTAGELLGLFLIQIKHWRDIISDMILADSLDKMWRRKSKRKTYLNSVILVSVSHMHSRTHTHKDQ